MRFLMNNKPILELTMQLMVAAVRLGNHGTADRTKMDSIIELFCSRFFKFENAKQII